MLHFTREEFLARQHNAIAAMQVRNLDGLLIFRQESMYYLTGYDTMGYSQFQCLYMGADGRLMLLTRSADLRQARLTYDATEAQVAGLVRQAVRDVQYQAEAVRAALQSRELARQQLAAERARYEEGLSTNYQVLEFQQALAQTQSSERAARVAFAKALVNMEYVQGYLGEQPTP